MFISWNGNKLAKKTLATHVIRDMYRLYLSNRQSIYSSAHSLKCKFHKLAKNKLAGHVTRDMYRRYLSTKTVYIQQRNFVLSQTFSKGSPMSLSCPSSFSWSGERSKSHWIWTAGAFAESSSFGCFFGAGNCLPAQSSRSIISQNIFRTNVNSCTGLQWWRSSELCDTMDIDRSCRGTEKFQIQANLVKWAKN